MYGDLDAAARNSMAGFDDQLSGSLPLDLAMSRSNAEFNGQLQADLDREFASMDRDAYIAQQSRMFARELDQSIRSADFTRSLNRALASLTAPQINFEPEPAAPTDMSLGLGYADTSLQYHSPLLAPLYDPRGLANSPYDPRGLTTRYDGLPWEHRSEPEMRAIDPAAEARLREQQNRIGAVFAGPVFGGGTYFAARALGASDAAAAGLAEVQIGLLPGGRGSSGRVAASVRRGTLGVPSATRGEAAMDAAAARSANTTRAGIVRTNEADWRDVRNLWDDLGYGEILSQENRAAIARGTPPRVDETWIRVFPEDAGLAGEQIRMHHFQGLPVTVPLPETRHMDAHMPGGFRYNPGGPGSAAPFYPAKPKGQ